MQSKFASFAAIFIGLISCKTSSSSATLGNATAAKEDKDEVQWILQEEFSDLKLTRDLPKPPFQSFRWYSREDTNVNNEVQKYRTYLHDDPQTKRSAQGIVCGGATTDKNACASDLWTLRIVEDDTAGDKNVLQIRSVRDKTSGTIYSARIQSKRFAEFAPSANAGIRVEIRFKFDKDAIEKGIWPAFWLLGSQNNEDPVIGDGDTIPWPCKGASEIALMEIGGATGRRYVKSPLYVGREPCVPYQPKETLFAETRLPDSRAFDDGNWHTLTLDWEADRAQFYHDGEAYGQALDISRATFNTKMFLVLNQAVGGTLGGKVDATSFDAGVSYYIDSIRVGTFPSKPKAVSGKTPIRLLASDHAEAVGLQFEACSEGGQNAGYIDPGDSITWPLHISADGLYSFKSRSAVNRPEGPAGITLSIRKKDEPKFTKIADKSLDSTNGWQNWRDFAIGTTQLAAGDYWIKVDFTSNGQNIYALDISKLGEPQAQSSARYDYIVVGSGASGAIAVNRLVSAGKNVLLIEAGGPTAKSVGGTDFPSYVKDKSRTIFDVPGEYANIPWKPKGDAYKLKEAGFTYQGMGYGGNTQFNGMLFQMAPAFDFDNFWPAGWKYADIKPYAEKVKDLMGVTRTPSKDGRHYLSPAADAVHAVYAKHGFQERDSSVLGDLGDRYYSYPYVASNKGQRGSVVNAYLESLIDENGKSKSKNLTIYSLSKVQRILFASDDPSKAIGVEFTRRKEVKDTSEGNDPPPETAYLSKSGKVVLAAGALITPRILLLSGVGPQKRSAEIFRDGFSVPLTINNDFIGTGLFDHVGAMVTYEFTGNNDYRSFDASDYSANAEQIQKYLSSGSGAYAQYGPISVAHDTIGPNAAGQANVEYFVNAQGAGTFDQPYNTSKDFSVYTMLLRPKAREPLHIGSNSFVNYPVIYLTDGEDMQTMALALQKLLTMMKENPNFKLKIGPGGQSHPNLDPSKLDDVKAYLSSWNPFVTPDNSQAHFSRLIMNHWGGTVPIGTAVDPQTLIVRGTTNIQVIDASLIPQPLSAHPVATIMAVAEKASDILLK